MNAKRLLITLRPLRSSLTLMVIILVFLSGGAFAKKNPEEVPGTQVEISKPSKKIPKNDVKREKKISQKKTKKNALEQRLGLTVEQTQKLEQNRAAATAQLKPIAEQIDTKCNKINKLLISNTADDLREQQIENLRAEIFALNEKAYEIKKQMVKDFEAILTEQQKSELVKIREEKTLK